MSETHDTDNAASFFTLAQLATDQAMAPYIRQFRQEIQVPDMEDPRKQHPIPKHLAKAALTPPQRADVVHELGRKHWLFYAASGRPVGKVA